MQSKQLSPDREKWIAGVKTSCKILAKSINFFECRSVKWHLSQSKPQKSINVQMLQMKTLFSLIYLFAFVVRKL